jgi:GAF domain-containing protein
MQRRDASARPVKKKRANKAKAREAPAAHRSTDHSPKQFDRLKRERDEALEQLSATSEVLKVISGSPGDLQPVFDTIGQRAEKLCGAEVSVISMVDGDLIRLVSVHGIRDEGVEVVRRVFPMRRNDETVTARAIRSSTICHVPDVLSDALSQTKDDALASRATDAARVSGYRACLAVPMIRDGQVLGAIFVARKQAGLFPEAQVALLKTFADQAVIAVGNTRLLNELRQRTDDLTESLEQQTATSEVLKVISGSPTDIQPVLDAVGENAARLCEANNAVIFQLEGNMLRHVASYGHMPTTSHPVEGLPVSRDTVTGRAVFERRTIHVHDLSAEDREYPEGSRHAKVDGHRTTLATPLLREGVPVGAILIRRTEVRPFSPKQIELVTTFADQAAIAIENVRLFNELRQRTDDLSESLEQQTATSEVLKVISSFPGEVEAVFASILDNAVRICEARFGNLALFDGTNMRVVAMHNAPPGYEKVRRENPIISSEGSMLGTVVRTKQKLHILDLASEKSFATSLLITAAGARSMLAVPMLKESQLIGALNIYRQEVRPFSDKQIALLENFAAQAVIAIENARLLNELRQSLEQQTATADVLKVISSSPGDLEPVFQSMLIRAVQICEAKFGVLFRCYHDSEFHAAAWVDVTPEYEKSLRERESFRPDADAPLGRLLLTKELVHTADELAEKRGSPAAKYGGARSLIAVPMRKQNELVGALVIYRTEVRPFTDKQIELVQNFAAQAVIAIENARLLDDLNKLNQQLEQRVTDQVGEIERMSRLRRFLPPQVADLIVASGRESQLESHRREITALFCDLRGFTGFSESADPEDVMALLREYHAAIGGIINKYGGTLERYAGDGVMVVFNDPIPVDNPALQAVRMAIDMRAAIGELIEKWRKLGHDIGFGIGIAHGFATLGTIGFEGRFDYAAIGTVSNVASRLCDEAKPGQILISPRVLMAVEKDITVEPVGDFALKGIRRPLAAYNVLASKAAN